MYDIYMIKDRLSYLRRYRWNLYKENIGKEENPYRKYAYCKTQELLAKQMELGRRTIGSWEKGKTIPSLDNLIELSNVLDCTVEYFLGEWDLPEATPIEKASHYSGISPEIIRYCIEHSDYRDCLNFFMLPENCSSLFNNITLSAWKKYWIDAKLSEIKNPLKDIVKDIFNEYNAVTPFESISKETYKAFLKSKLPEDRVIINSKKCSNGISIKACLLSKVYFDLISKDKELRYYEFVNYLTEYTYMPLTQNAVLEL